MLKSRKRRSYAFKYRFLIAHQGTRQKCFIGLRWATFIFSLVNMTIIFHCVWDGCGPHTHGNAIFWRFRIHVTVIRCWRSHDVDVTVDRVAALRSIIHNQITWKNAPIDNRRTNKSRKSLFWQGCHRSYNGLTPALIISVPYRSPRLCVFIHRRLIWGSLWCYIVT